MILPYLLLAVPGLFPQSRVSVETGTINQKVASGDCSFNVAAVSGNVTVVNCPGVPVTALQALNRELREMRLSEADARKQTEIWREKFESLEAGLATAGLSAALVEKASEYLSKGDLPSAAQQLDSALKQADQQVMQAATTHYYRGKVAGLQFDRTTELQQLEAAYKLAPHGVLIAIDYGNCLNENGRFAEAEAVFTNLLKEASESKQISLQAASALNMATALKFEGNWQQSKLQCLESAKLFELASKAQESNALNNEAVALSCAADIANLQGESAEALELNKKAIDVEQSDLTQVRVSPQRSSDELNLAAFRVNACDVYINQNALDRAVQECESAISESSVVPDSDHNTRAASIKARALTKECFIFARKGDDQAADERCERSVKILNVVLDQDGRKVVPDLAGALQMKAMVLEDENKYAEAKKDFSLAAAYWDEIIGRGQLEFRFDQTRTELYLFGAAYLSGDRDSAIAHAKRAAQLSEGLTGPFSAFRAQVLQEAASVLANLGQTADASEFSTELHDLQGKHLP